MEEIRLIKLRQPDLITDAGSLALSFLGAEARKQVLERVVQRGSLPSNDHGRRPRVQIFRDQTVRSDRARTAEGRLWRSHWAVKHPAW